MLTTETRIMQDGFARVRTAVQFSKIQDGTVRDLFRSKRNNNSVDMKELLTILRHSKIYLRFLSLNLSAGWKWSRILDLWQVVKERRSIRKFKDDPIPEIIIKEILYEARWSPSWGNTQPWEFYVITGEPLRKYKEMNCGKFDEGVQQMPDITMPSDWSECLKQRYSENAKSRLNSLNIARENRAGRNEFTRYVYGLFNAPCLIIGCIDKNSSSIEYAMLDMGLIIQTICLLAHDKGLGTCIMACAVHFPSDLKVILPEAENKLMVVGIALGYPDMDAPINNFKRNRAPIEESVIWVK